VLVADWGESGDIGETEAWEGGWGVRGIELVERGETLLTS